jgi:hypothetical protein
LMFWRSWRWQRSCSAETSTSNKLAMNAAATALRTN